jgi:hypothetical protein
MQLLSAVLSLLLAFGVTASASVKASIHVRVIDQHGNPVPGSWVYLEPAGSSWDAPFSCTTGGDGTCTLVLEGMAKSLPGDYIVSAMKESDGYPMPSSFFYGNDVFPGFQEGLNGEMFSLKSGQLMVTMPGQTAVKVLKDLTPREAVIRLGPKQGILKVIATDSFTGKEIDDVMLTSQWRSAPRNSVNGQLNKTQVFLVPFDLPVTLVVGAEGYQEWTYTSTADPADHTIKLHSGERLTLRIQLKPKN